MTYNDTFGLGETFKGLDGKEYIIAPLSLKEWAEFVRWVQYKPYRDALSAELPEKKCDEIYKKCQEGKIKEKVPPDDWPEDEDCPEDKLVEKEFDIELFAPDVLNTLLKPEGLHRLLEISLGINYPELRGKPLNNIVNLSNEKELTNKILKANGLAIDIDEKEPEKNAQSPNATHL